MILNGSDITSKGPNTGLILNLSRYSIKYHAMKMYGVEVNLHVFLTTELDGRNSQRHT
jgi:hypothetical protein